MINHPPVTIGHDPELHAVFKQTLKLLWDGKRATNDRLCDSKYICHILHRLRRQPATYGGACAAEDVIMRSLKCVNGPGSYYTLESWLDTVDPGYDKLYWEAVASGDFAVFQACRKAWLEALIKTTE